MKVRRREESERKENGQIKSTAKEKDKDRRSEKTTEKMKNEKGKEETGR